MPNQTIVAIPADISDVDEFRQALVRLVIELDLLLGLRSGAADPLATQSFVNDAIEEALASTITPLEPFVQVITNPPTQAEVQELSDMMGTVITKVNEIINE